MSVSISPTLVLASSLINARGYYLILVDGFIPNGDYILRGIALKCGVGVMLR